MLLAVVLLAGFFRPENLDADDHRFDRCAFHLGPMFAFVIRRLVQAVLVMLTVAFIAFMLFQYVGDPVTICWNKFSTLRCRASIFGCFSG